MVSSRSGHLPGDSYRGLSLMENPDLEEPEVTQEVSTLGREQLHFWGSFLRRSFIFCSTVALVYAAVYSCTREEPDVARKSFAMQRLNMLLPPGPAANTLHCLKDEEQFAGLCYMKCSLLTGGRAPHRVANTACCKTDNDFFCQLLSSDQAISASLSVGGGAAIHNNPHAPGVGGICGLNEEAYQGLCYPQCKDLTKGKSPHRVGSFSCCAGTQVECLQGKGTMSATAEYGRSVIPAAKDTGRSYKAINLMDARCDGDEDEFNGLCYSKCSELTFGQGSIRTGPSTCCTCGSGIFEGLCCMIPWNDLTDISYAVGTSRHGKVTDPHPPGMRVRCSSLEEEFEGICYQKCSDLTDNRMPHRISSISCCKFEGESACRSAENAVVDINLDKSQALSNALPHAPYMRPETD